MSILARGPADPVRALQQFTELPYQFGLIGEDMPEVSEQLEEIYRRSAQLQQESTPDEWIELYRESLIVGERLLGRLAEVNDDLIKQRMEEPSPQMWNSRLRDQPEKAMEQLPSRIKQGLQEKRATWQQRIQRQHDYVYNNAKNALERVTIAHETMRDGIVSSFELSQLQAYQGWLVSAVGAWERDLTEGFQADTQQVLQRRRADVEKAFDQSLSPMNVPAPRGLEGQLGLQTQGLTPSRKEEVPGFLETVGKFAMTNFFRLGMMMMIFGAGAEGLVCASEQSDQPEYGESTVTQSSSSSSSRYKYYGYAIILALGIGVVWAHKDRKKLIPETKRDSGEKLRKNARDALATDMKTVQGQLSASVDRHINVVMDSSLHYVDHSLGPVARQLAEKAYQQSYRAERVHEDIKGKSAQLTQLKGVVEKTFRAGVQSRVRELELEVASGGNPADA